MTAQQQLDAMTLKMNELKEAVEVETLEALVVEKNEYKTTVEDEIKGVKIADLRALYIELRVEVKFRPEPVKKSRPPTQLQQDRAAEKVIVKTLTDAHPNLLTYLTKYNRFDARKHRKIRMYLQPYKEMRLLFLDYENAFDARKDK